VHGPTRVVLQRQFFEAVVRAAYVKYANKSDLPTLAEKLEYLFKHKLTPNAGKTKAKSVEEEVSDFRFVLSHCLPVETIQDCRESLGGIPPAYHGV